MPALSGQKTVTTAGTAEAFGSQAIGGPLMVKALDTNTSVVALGNDGAEMSPSPMACASKPATSSSSITLATWPASGWTPLSMAKAFPGSSWMSKRSLPLPAFLAVSPPLRLPGARPAGQLRRHRCAHRSHPRYRARRFVLGDHQRHIRQSQRRLSALHLRHRRTRRHQRRPGRLRAAYPLQALQCLSEWLWLGLPLRRSPAQIIITLVRIVNAGNPTISWNLPSIVIDPSQGASGAGRVIPGLVADNYYTWRILLKGNVARLYDESGVLMLAAAGVAKLTNTYYGPFNQPACWFLGLYRSQAAFHSLCHFFGHWRQYQRRRSRMAWRTWLPTTTMATAGLPARCHRRTGQLPDGRATPMLPKPPMQISPSFCWAPTTAILQLYRRISRKTCRSCMAPYTSRSTPWASCQTPAGQPRVRNPSTATSPLPLPPPRLLASTSLT